MPEFHPAPKKPVALLIFKDSDTDLGAGLLYYLSPDGMVSTEDDAEIVIPKAGTLKNLYFKPGSGSSYGGYPLYVTVRKNGANTTLTCTATSDAGCNDTTHEVAVAAGDEITIQLDSGAASAGSFYKPAAALVIEF